MLPTPYRRPDSPRASERLAECFAIARTAEITTDVLALVAEALIVPSAATEDASGR